MMKSITLRCHSLQTFLIVFVFWTISVQGYEVSICAIFRDEKRFLKEWIDYHLLIGVDHFYLYDHLSQDNPKEVLDPYIEKGIVDYFPWHYEFEAYKEWGQIQTKAYNDCINRSKETTKWLAIIDSDEFIVPVAHQDIKKFLKEYENYGGVGINWLVFGTNQVSEVPEGGWMIKYLTKRARLNQSINRHIKSIVQPKKVKACKNAHFCLYKRAFFQVDANKKKFKGPFTDVLVDRIRLHHYWSRDEYHFYNFKIKSLLRRGRKGFSYDSIIQMEKTLNEEDDYSILELINSHETLTQN